MILATEGSVAVHDSADSRAAGTGGAAAAGRRHRVAIQRLTVMLTETCNLDCWMCDFAKSKKQTKTLALTPGQLVETLRHPVFSSLRAVTMTGGEPFAHPQVLEYYRALREAYPKTLLYFSSNCTLLPKMMSVFETVRDWNAAGLLVSVDGIDKHDQQRGTPGAFNKTLANLEALRERFPKLPITLKITITPVNCDEIEKAYFHLVDRGFVVTTKLLEHNPYYTAKLRQDEGLDQFDFTPEQLVSIREQMSRIRERSKRMADHRRAAEIDEVLRALSPDWRRRGKCMTPVKAGFLDCDLNLFTCKEYAPVINLKTGSLDHLPVSPALDEICRNEANNTGKCTRCSSQMKIQSGVLKWLDYFTQLARS